MDKDYTQLNPVALLLALSSEQVVETFNLEDMQPQTVESPPISRKLTAEEIDFFNKHGYLIVKKVFDDSDFKDFEDDYSKLIDDKAKELLAQGKIMDSKEGLGFQYRFAAIAEQCSDQVFHEDILPFCRKLDCMFALTKGFFRFMLNPKLLSVVESIVGPEITVNPIQHVRPYLPSRNGTHNRNYSSEKGEGAIAHPALAPWHVGYNALLL